MLTSNENVKTPLKINNRTPLTNIKSRQKLPRNFFMFISHEYKIDFSFTTYIFHFRKKKMEEEEKSVLHLF